MINYRRWQLFLVFINVLLLLSAFYLEYVEELQPCPLCLMQRFCGFLLLILSLLGLLTTKFKQRSVLSLMQMLIALGGIFFAGRQLWLQSLSGNSLQTCLPGADLMIHYLPWKDLLRAFFWGSGDCGEVEWQFLGLSMASWATVYFVFIFSLNLFIYFKTRFQPHLPSDIQAQNEG